MQIIRDDDVLIGDHTFDRRDDHFMGHVAADLRQRLLHIGRWNRENQHVRLRYGLVDIRREMDTAHVKIGGAEIGRVLARGDELVNHLLATNEPVQLRLVLHDNLRQRSSP